MMDTDLAKDLSEAVANLMVALKAKCVYCKSTEEVTTICRPCWIMPSRNVNEERRKCPWEWDGHWLWYTADDDGVHCTPEDGGLEGKGDAMNQDIFHSVLGPKPLTRKQEKRLRLVPECHRCHAGGRVEVCSNCLYPYCDDCFNIHFSETKETP